MDRDRAHALIVANTSAIDGAIARAIDASVFNVRSAQLAVAVDIAQTLSPDLIVVIAVDTEASAELQCLRRLRVACPDARVAFLATVSCEDLVIRALHAGAERYLRQPLDAEALRGELRALCPDRIAQRDDSPPLVNGHWLIGRSQASANLRTYLARISPAASNVLISGETGTGKELVAELIHANGPRATKPFVCLNTTAIPESLVESELFGYERGAFTGASTAQQGKLCAAQGGTAFLDEIGDASLPVQAKLLRAIENKSIHPIGGIRSVKLDVRFIAATNQNLERAANEGRFRWDLYYRLNVIRIELPPLRDRPEDIPMLVGHYIRHFNRELGRSIRGLSPRAMEALCAYHWPGNIRELRNVIEALAVNLAPETEGIVDVPPVVMRQLAFAVGAPTSERERLLQALAATNWNKSRAASQLHCSRMTLYRKMRIHELSQPR
jgi:DNA-binding NtrC family response regulator